MFYKIGIILVSFSLLALFLQTRTENQELKKCEAERRIYSQVIDNYFEDLWHDSSDYEFCLFDVCRDLYHYKGGAEGIGWDKSGFLCSYTNDDSYETDDDDKAYFLVFIPSEKLRKCEPYKMHLPWWTFKSYN